MSAQENIKVNSASMQDQVLYQHEQDCHEVSTAPPGWCPKTWDGIQCWPNTPPGEMSEQSCPSYLAGFDLQANATKQCMPDGQWFWSAEMNSTWTNYTQCYNAPLVTVLMDSTESISNSVMLVKEYVPVIKKISTVGYAVSFSTLVVAFLILAIIKKLRCSRNILHMHLFASFMARAFMALLKEVLFVSGLGLASDVLTKDDDIIWRANEIEGNWQCKAFTSVWQYFILANYSWILMEGLYLHNLVFNALFTDSNSSIAAYALLGWGLPAIFVLPWVIMRATLEDTYCWTTHKNPFLFWSIRAPTVLSILINFVLFVNIVRVLLSKLKSTVSEETQRYKRWARSTLVLVPLFGVHYTVFLGMSYNMGDNFNHTVHVVWLFSDQLFASFQGSFVAVLYCFLNGEVRTEVTRAIRSRKWPRFRHGRWGPRSSTHSSSTCSCNGAKFDKSHKGLKCWTRPWACFFHDHDAHRSTHSMASTQDVATRGGSLASSRGYLEIVSHGHNSQPNDCHQGTIPNHTVSPLCSKYTDQSLLSFCSNASEGSIRALPSAERDERIRDQHRWSDSECCSLAFELHTLQQQALP